MVFIGISLQSMRVMARLFFNLAVAGKAADQLEISDDAGGVVQIIAFALGAAVQTVLADMSTILTQGIGDIEGEVAASGLDGHIQQQKVLRLGQMLVQIDVAGRTAVQIAGEFAAMQLQLVQQQP